MNWGLIPEVFYDLIARVVPGSLFLVGALAVYFGPAEFARVLGESLPSANAASLLPFVLLAYFAAIVLKAIWEVLSRLAPRRASGPLEGKLGEDRPLSDLILGIQERIPSEASRLLKLQAEKSMCEVLVPGLAILLFTNVWISVAGASGELGERIVLAAILLISGLACSRWRKNLEGLYRRDLETLAVWAKQKPPNLSQLERTNTPQA